MSQHYLDTNPLMRWAESKAASGDQRSVAAGQRVEELVLGGTVTAISEITLIEFHDNISNYVRNNKTGDHDASWMKLVQQDLMTWIASAGLVVLPPFPRMHETAMSYITLAADQGRRLRAWDAVHLCRATEWSRETRTRVTIITGDADFESFVGLFPRFGEFIDIEKVGV